MQGNLFATDSNSYFVVKTEFSCYYHIYTTEHMMSVEIIKRYQIRAVTSRSIDSHTSVYPLTYFAFKIER